ncbi:NosD domain-containing protein [Natronorubrum aibiense]|uniref:Nitrous oxide reductase accessory protein NosL/NosD n=1 Tax=Natronorubrum aibiense TaxID=348826 RepID=A0A5P9P3T2_9EURY|nr:NosD domain-containing protein [Natronorubrum aibiense]QFU82793.1 nitrous oxide reductase accessory protein NosL/NosD [Natronorubrum aibiense]
MLEMSRDGWLAVALAVVLLGSVGLFAVDVGTSTPDPVEFDDTVQVGLSLEEQFALENDVKLPRAQVFYSKYSYVVGYQGVERFVDERAQPTHTDRFGYPLAVYVTDYSAVDVELREDGYPVADENPPWIDAESAWFVAGSDARSPAGETVVAFSDRDDAEAFASAHGGEVLAWNDVLESEFDIDDAEVVRDRLDDRLAEADETSTQADTLRDRPVSVVVGEDADTIQAAVDAAPANTTVAVPAGRYDERVEIDKPITLAGEGDATIAGPGWGSVVTVTANRTAVTGFEITGVGDETAGTDVVPDHGPEERSGRGEGWDEELTEHYAGGDAGVAISGGAEGLVADVSIRTPSNGVLLYESPDTVVRNVTVDGAEISREGRAGVNAIYSAAVIEDSTIRNGRDGVYTHESADIVIRNNTVVGNRLGVHLMHTSDAVIVGNEFREQDATGIYVMTGPERIAIVDNTVRDTDTGIIPDSDDSYIASNVVEGTQVGIKQNTASSVIEGNVVAGNDVGVEERSVLPTNRIVRNDFVGNRDHVTAANGPLRIWSDDGAGNYWQGATALSTIGERPSSYSPTDSVHERLHLTDGTAMLARAPALEAISGFEGMVPGLRTDAVIDSAPTCEPNNPTLLERTAWADQAWTCEQATG